MVNPFKFLTRRRAEGGDSTKNFDRNLILSLKRRRLPSLAQLKYLPRFLDKREAAALKVLFVAAALCFFAAGAKYSSDHLKTVPTAGGDYAEATVGTPRLVNPVLASGSDADRDLVRLTFAGLLRADSDGNLQTDLAESWEVSADGKIYTFRLLPNLKFHDDVALTARDVAFTYDLAKNPAVKSPLLTRFRNVDIEAQDDLTITFTLPEPFAPFSSYLTLGIMPEHLWSAVKAENVSLAELNIKPVGAGPFKFKGLIKDKKGSIRSYTVARNDLYHRAPAYLDSVTLKFYPDFASAADALTTRRVDGLSYLPDDYLETVVQLRTVNVHRLRVPQYTAVFLNPNRNPFLKDKAVRQALAVAINRDLLIREAARAGSLIVNSPILPWQVGYSADAKRYAYDETKAGEALDDAGWVLADDGRRYKSKDKNKETPLAVTITTVDTKENAAAARLVAEAWTAVGVKVDVETVPAARLQREKLRPRAYDALLYGELTGLDPDPYPFWHSSQTSESGLNLSLWQNRKADEALEQGRKAITAEARASAYQEFQKLLTEDAAAIFLYSPSYSYAVSRRFHGIEGGTVADPADRFNGITGWFVETKRVWE